MKISLFLVKILAKAFNSKPYVQARNQLGTPGAKDFLRTAQIF